MAWIETGANNTEPKLEHRTMTVILNLNTPDPTQWAVYDDDAIFMEAGSDEWDEFFGHYPCILENGVELGKLDRNDFSKYEDGTAAPITTLGKDVMICFPRRGIKIEYLDADILSVSMTKEEGKEGYSYWAHSYSNENANLTNAVCDKFYLGAYKGYVSSNILYSTSGKTPDEYKTVEYYRTCAKNKGGWGGSYEQSGFFQLTFRQVMYLLKYKGQNAQIAVGKGFVNGSDTKKTGATNSQGMDYGTTSMTTQMKLFGLEDFYGNIDEYIEGFWSNSNGQLYVSDGNFNNTGYGYINTGIQVSYNINSTFLRYPNGTNLTGFTIKNSTAGTADTFFCDCAATSPYSCIGAFGGNYYRQNMTGVFYFFIQMNPTEAMPRCGARLMYMHVAE